MKPRFPSNSAAIEAIAAKADSSEAAKEPEMSAFAED